MTDYFALFDEPRRPWLDPEALRERFLTRSAEVHPDRVHTASEEERRIATQQYAELNAAYNCLRESRPRLRHLLELEAGAKPKDVQRLSSELMDLSLAIGQACRETDVFLAEKSKVSSPLLKVQLFDRGQEWSDKLSAPRQGVSRRREELLGDLKILNGAWESAPLVGSPARVEALPLARLEEIYRLLSYFDRWTAQIQERVVQLAL